jgi:putative membrane protein
VIRLIIATPFLLLLVLFALSNPQPTEFRLWGTDYSATVPLSLAVLGAMAVAFLAGALVLWLSVLAARRRARRAEHVAKLLEAQVAELKARLAPAPTALATRVEARPLLPAGR